MYDTDVALPIRIGSNIASLVAQRALSAASDRASTSFERLSSGLRINRASDDAAGIAIASSLRTDSRVFNQGIRNFNDGISYLSIAEGALTEMTQIVARQAELSAQASNGTFSLQQRLSLQKEADALTEEFNRIIESTTFNDINLFSASNQSVRLQLGYGLSGSLNASFLSSF